MGWAGGDGEGRGGVLVVADPTTASRQLAYHFKLYCNNKRIC